MAIYQCHHNPMVTCEVKECGHCGWNPTVAAVRLAKFTGGDTKMPNDKLYKVPFTGFCEVWADSPEAAADKAEDFVTQFYAQYDYGEPECLEKEDTDE